jgi:HAD superfamily hydrolase (TIGR01509 family)
MLNNIEAVIFDLDGTLVDSMWVWNQIDVEYLNNKGYALPDDLQRDIQGLSYTETALYFKDRFQLTDTVDEIKQEWNRMANHYYSSVINIKKGVKEFLEYLKSNGYKIGIATSNYIDQTKAVLSHNGILEYFQAITTACEVPRSKAYPDVFLETARRLHVPPEKCLVFEDSIVSIGGAKAAGMQVIGVFDSHGTCSYQELSKITNHLIEDFSSMPQCCKA